MKEKQEFCQNCGHICHCDSNCEQEVVNEFGEKYQIECCKSCRHEIYDGSWKDTIKYDTLDVDSFNGA